MSECIKLAACPFFNDRMQGMDGMAGLYKKRYCAGDHALCARWMVSSAGVPVPPDLFPNQAERAEELLREAGKA